MAMPSTATGIVLAGGGKNADFDQDPGLLEVNGEPLINELIINLSRIFHKILISTNQYESYTFVGLPLIGDFTVNYGPLMGIYSSLEASHSEINFIISNSIPQFDQDMVKEMLSLGYVYDAVIPRFSDGSFEPYMGVYKKSTLSYLRDAIDAGEKDVRTFLDNIETHYMDIQDASWYYRIKSKEDFERYQSSIKGS